jgi:hypothetical protein
MQLIAPDILLAARGLTGAMAGTACALGLALWLFGWRWHRFWIVAGVTLAAGLIGLNSGRASGGTQVMAVGILLAVSAGLMALELAKVLAFVAGGCGAWLAVQWVLPQAQELWAACSACSSTASGRCSSPASSGRCSPGTRASSSSSRRAASMRSRGSGGTCPP